MHTQHNIGNFVISVGTDHELLSLREAVLKQAGFHVFTVSDEKQALEQIGTVDCGVLLLCYSIDNVIRQQLAKQYRVACPRGRILAITNAPFEYPPVEADAFLYGVEGAEALITAVSQVQKETGNSPKDGADAAAEAGEK